MGAQPSSPFGWTISTTVASAIVFLSLLSLDWNGTRERTVFSLFSAHVNKDCSERDFFSHSDPPQGTKISFPTYKPACWLECRLFQDEHPRPTYVAAVSMKQPYASQWFRSGDKSEWALETQSDRVQKGVVIKLSKLYAQSAYFRRLWHSVMQRYPSFVHQVWPKPSCKAQWKGEEDKVDRGRGGRTTSGNGQAWSLAGPRGQWRTGKNGKKLVAELSVVHAPTTLAVKE